MKKINKKKHSSAGWGAKSASCLRDKSGMNRSSTAAASFPHLVCIRFRLLVLLERNSRIVVLMVWGLRGSLASLAYCWKNFPSARPPPCASRPKPPVICPCSRTCLAGKGCTKTNRRRYTGQQPGTKSAVRLFDKLQMNRGSPAGSVLPSVFLKYELDCSRFQRNVQGDVLDLLGARRRVVSRPDRPNGVLSNQAWLRPAALPCAAPTRQACDCTSE